MTYITGHRLRMHEHLGGGPALPQIAYWNARWNGCGGAISVTEQSCAAPRRSLKRRVTYRIDVHTMTDSFAWRREKPSGYSVASHANVLRGSSRNLSSWGRNA